MFRALNTFIRAFPSTPRYGIITLKNAEGKARDLDKRKIQGHRGHTANHAINLDLGHYILAAQRTATRGSRESTTVQLIFACKEQASTWVFGASACKNDP